MELLLGFAIAVVIAMTGVGAGAMTAPLLILFLHLPVTVAVGTALVFSAIVKLVVVPVQMWRGRVAYRTLGRMLLTGLPGVLLGSLLFDHIAATGHRDWLYLALGVTIASSSAWHIYRHFQPAAASTGPYSIAWLSALMLPIGAEVGFSSSGAGALASVALLSFTTLDTATVIGTDLAFGLCLSFTGGLLHMAYGGCDYALLARLAAGGVLGAIAGAGASARIPMRAMRLALSVWLFAVGMELCYRALAAVRG